jgi:hypothetical protein
MCNGGVTVLIYIYVNVKCVELCNRLLLWFVFLVCAVCFVFFREGLVVRIGS